METTLSKPENGSAISPERRHLPHREALADANRFIANLADMRSQEPGKPNLRGQLAQLKRNAGEKWPGRNVAWFAEKIYQGKESPWRQENLDIYFLVATLFDLNRFPAPKGESKLKDLGFSMRHAVNEGANEVGVKRRFQILLDSQWDDCGDGELAFRLRQTVQWLASQRVGLDWGLLLTDLCFWNSETRFVEKNWARSFFNAPLALRATDPTAPETELTDEIN
jgi:CRISPR system Cascade subunit CasB